MDTLSHALWIGAGAVIAQRKRLLEVRTTIAITALAVLPDVVHLVPIAFWSLFGGGSFAAFYAYAVALPGQEPAMPPVVSTLAHHFHCVMHSAPIAAAITALAWMVHRPLWIPLLGWWSHIVIDVFTHSVDYYPSPVLYPITYRGFDGLAWNDPKYLVVNYVVLVAIYLWLFRTRKGNNSL